MNNWRKTIRGGYIMIINTLLFISILIVIIVGVANIVLSHFGTASAYVYSKQSYLASHSAIDEAFYRLKAGLPISSSGTFSVGSTTVPYTVSNMSFGKRILATSTVNGYVRTVQLDITLGSGISFHYGIQSGDGGFQMLNSSVVTGNVFSSGPITGTGNWIKGDVVSAGSSGLIDGIHATGTAFAHTIRNSIVDKHAYYMTISNTTVGGTSYPNSPDQPIAPLPISDAQIAEWETFAEAGGTATCTAGQYKIEADATIGPLKIPCDLIIKGVGITVTIAGHIWVTGNIETQTSPTIRIDPALGSTNIAVIADNQANRTSSSIITIGQNTDFQNSGAIGSFVFLISQNNSAETGGTTNAINLGNSASSMVAYASHGLITLGQSVGVKEATAYKIILQNTANVVYDTGLPSVLFDSGPGASYDVIDWLEI